ncbi:dermonecrotic toxin domain-containing protein [Pseudomonas sp. XS1P51]
MNKHDHGLATHPDTHYQHLSRILPSWVLQASPNTRSALKNVTLDVPFRGGQATRLHDQTLKALSIEHWSHRNRLDHMLGKLLNARDFAAPLLAEALKTRFGLELDVKTTFLRLYIPQTIPWFPVKSGAARTWTVSLLDAALHNFQESETQRGAYESASTFITEPSPTGQFDTLPTIKQKITLPEFTRLCRELDIGSRYSAYLNNNLGVTNPLIDAVLRPNVRNAHQAALKSALHLGRLRQDLEDDACDSILGLLEGRPGMKLNGEPLHCHDLTMMSSALTGIVIFAPDLERARKAARIVVYIPDDPEHPIKQYPDTLAFMTELTRKLRSPAYQQFFSRFVDHPERGHFFADLNRRLSAVTWHQGQHGNPLPNWRDTPIDKPNLQFSVSAIKTGLWSDLYQRQLNKILNDARTIAVSTASADRNARWARWDAFSKIASTILEVAAFVALPFVPFLGELTLAYMAWQALDETFEGIVDWAEGLKKEAFAHLMGVVESAVQLGTFAVGGAIIVGELKPLLPRDTLTFFDKLTPVKTSDGKTRYWKPDLSPYEHSVNLPTTAKPDHLGLYWHEGKNLLPIEGKRYAVERNSQTGQFEIQHPDRVDAYQPPLRHNGHGAWQTGLEQPLSWDRETVMRRIGHSVESFSSVEREQILRVSGYHDNVLREMHVDNLPPPSLLTDVIKRFKIDRDLQTLSEQIGSSDPEHYQALTHRKSLFESRYRALEATDNRAAQRLIADVQGLPTDVAQELVRNATGSELLQLHNDRVPRRLKDVAQKAMEAVRASRAYEGLYSDSLETVDTHRLALHSLDSLPGWPDTLRIEVRDYSHDGVLRDSIGHADASPLKTLVRAEDGTYQVHEGSELPGDFYTAILQALPETERNALALSIEDGQSLKQRIAAHALGQPALRTLFAKNPHRKPFYDPTTMRLPGGTEGYRRTHSKTPTLNDRVREVYPDLTQEELRSVVAHLQRHPDGARVELSRLSRELERLHQDLDTWINDAPTVHPETRLPLSDLEQQAQRHNRRLLAQEIQRSWRRQSDRDLDSPGSSDRYVLRFAEPILGDLPALTADFNHVSLLSLEGSHAEQGIHGFLQRFNGLRRLDLRRFSLTTLPDAIPQMTNLDALVLNDCGIRFDIAAWSKLSSLKKLVMLDLYKNPFERVPDIDSLSELVHLDLSDTGLAEIPDSAMRHPKLDTLMLMNNRITELPAGIFDSVVYDKRGVHLSRNPLTNQARQLIKHQYFETSYDLGVFAPEADIERVRALYPNLEVEQASDLVYELPGTLEDGRVELTNLEAELAQLSNDLAAWTANLPPRHPLTGEPFNAQQQLIEHANRDEFKQALEQCWRHESELDDFNDALEPSFELNISPVINGDLPTLSADFSHVSALELQSLDGVTGIGSFLESFPNLKSLRLRDCNLGNIPDAVFKMGQLRSLSLPNCRITLSPESANALAGMELLDYLDLGHNPLGQTPDLSQIKELATVLLHDTGITKIPQGLYQLEELDWADLSTNAITEMPSDVLELPVEIAENINLRGNRFSEESLVRMISYYERTGVDFGVDEVINRGEMEVSSTDGSEVDE